MELQRYTKRKLFLIDSDDRWNGAVENFNINIDMPFRENFNTCCVLNLECDKSYYLLDNISVNSFSITATTTETVTIAPGYNYTVDEFIDIVETALNAASAGGTFVVTYDTNDNKYTISNTLAFSFDFTDVPQIAKYLGFEEDIVTATLDGATYYLISSKIAKLQRYDNLVVKSNIAVNNNNPELCFIYPNSIEEGATIKYETQDTIATSVGKTAMKSNSYNFQLYGDDNKIVNLQGGSWRMLLALSEETF